VAYDEELADRIRPLVHARGEVREQKMFGGLALMLHGHMCCGVIGDNLVVRLGRDGADAALDEPHTRPMDFTGRPLSGFIYVEPDGVADDAALEAWIDRAAAFVETLPAKA
jgi:TfoX/Sxy family transcriptional regulator of competence genes